ncbi:MAG: hypothetical protein AMXMBFR81_21760 [Chthonomonas sp.]
MLVFIDESYKQDDSGRIHHALAGFGIQEAQYRKLVAIVHQIKEKYFESADGLSREQLTELRTLRIACSGEPRRAELKASKLLTDKAAEFHIKTGRAQSIMLVEELLDQVQSLDGVVFGVLSEPEHVDQIQKPGQFLPIQLRALMERVELWMRESHPQGYANLVLDAINDRTSRELNTCTSDYLFRSKDGRGMRHIVPTLFWVDSDSTPGSQVADIMAHVLMNSMLPEEQRKPLGTIWRKVSGMMFQSEDGRTRGIRRIRKRATGGSVAH